MTSPPAQRQPPKLTEVKILKRQNITHDLWIIWLQKPEGYMFKPGQYCTIGLDGIERPYSIVSAPHEQDIELFIELVPPEHGGVLTPPLWTLEVGDSVTIRPRAKGIFTLDPNYLNHMLVGTVTGTVPYISFIRHYIHHSRQGHRFYILDGGSYFDELYYGKELAQLVARRPELVTYIPTISRPNEKRNRGWTGETGRVNTIVDKYAVEFNLTPEDTLIYACGHPGMIEDVKARMIAKRFEIKEERFWKED